MALSSFVVWELRPGSGSNANGGGFDPSVTSPGTDQTQSNSAAFSGTDLASVSSLVVSSASHNFVSTDVGNVINISTTGTGAHFTTGFYTIVSVAANQATLDRSPGTVGVAGTWALGGALSTLPPMIASNVGLYSGANMVSGNICYVKATATITLTAVIGWNFGGPNPFTLIGYTTTRGDNGQVTVTTSTNSISILACGSSSCVWQNFIFTNTAGTRGLCIDGASNQVAFMNFRNCVFSGFTQAFNLKAYHFGMDNCEVKSCTSSVGAIQLTTYVDALFYGCYIHGNSGAGFTTTNTSGTSGHAAFVGCVFYSNSYGIQNISDGAAGAALGLTCIATAFVSQTNDGILDFGSGVNSPQTLRLYNCIFASNSGFGVNLKALTAAPIGYPMGAANAYYSNTGGNVNGFPALPGDVSLSASPFTSPSGNDFTLNSTAGGGAACKAAGYQSSLI